MVFQIVFNIILGIIIIYIFFLMFKGENMQNETNEKNELLKRNSQYIVLDENEYNQFIDQPYNVCLLIVDFMKKADKNFQDAYTQALLWWSIWERK